MSPLLGPDGLLDSDPGPDDAGPDDPGTDDPAERLFLALLDAGPGERRALLAAAPAPDASEAARLLEAYGQSGSFLGVLDEAPLTALLNDDDLNGDLGDDDDDGLAEGTRVGPWRVVREAGRGGMGRVYLAERADGAFEQRVALKMVRPEAGGTRLARRFERERRILARLDHPGLARVVDGGADLDGRPYLAMVFADGEPITAYCDRRQLGIAARLALVEDVVAAVAYAHRRLVVHRDLKPSNVFAADGLPVPGGAPGRPGATLLDFGLATLLDDSPGDALAAGGLASGPITGPLGPILTPEYAAPEQIAGEPATTATDDYALGVLLYELLAGVRPYAFERRTAAEIERVVTTVEPARPSAALTAAAAETRAAAPHALRRALAGDLDTLVLKALAKDPARRYASAEALGDDLRRHRLGLPLRARPSTFAYRMSRFARRNRLLVGATVAVVAALGLGLAATLVQARAARAQAARAEAARDLLVGLFAPANPDVANADSISARMLLDSAGVRIERDLAGHPALQAEMGTLLGGILLGLNAHAAALPLFEQADARIRRLPPGTVPDPGAARAGLGTCLIHTGGDIARATALITDAHAVQRDALGPGHPTTAGTAASLAELWAIMGEPERVDSLLRITRNALRTAPTRTTPAGREALASVLTRTAEVQKVRGDVEGSEASAREALALFTALGSPLGTMDALVALGTAQYAQGDFAGAERAFRADLRISTDRSGLQSLATISAERLLARVLADRSGPGDSEQAGRLYLSAGARAERLGARGIAATSYGEWAMFLARDGYPAEAAPLAARATALIPAYNRVVSHIWQANVDLAEGEYAAARAGFEAGREEFPVLSAIGVGLAYDREGRTAEAVRAYRAAARAQRDRPTTASNAAQLDYRLGDALARTGRPAEGRRLLARADSATAAIYGPDHRFTRRVRDARRRAG